MAKPWGVGLAKGAQGQILGVAGVAGGGARSKPWVSGMGKGGVVKTLGWRHFPT